ncbi:hypothetical protein ABBQ32_001621 [Trebouxia sp. C0010 RCD-2024]
METRRSKRKEAAASESLAPEPRNKRARRAQADKGRANTAGKVKEGAGPSTVSKSETVPASKPAVPKVQLESESEPAASESAPASTSQAEASTKSKEANLDKSMGSRKDLAEAQERAAVEQVN